MIYNTYVIIPTNELTDSMVDSSVNTENSIRFNIDGSKAVLKFCSKFPSSVQGYDKFSHLEILSILSTEEWSGSI